MKKLLAVLCLMLTASPLAWAQDKTPAVAGKAAPAAAAPTVVAPAAAAPNDNTKTKREPTDSEKLRHQSRKECDAAAGERKGDERKKFMVACLKDKKRAQEERQKTCNKEATDKKLSKSDRKVFMKDCLFPNS